MPVKSRYHNHLLEMLAALDDARVKFIVCGGVAAVLHGVERMTLDLDLSIDFTPLNVKRFSAALRKLGLTPRVPIPAEVLSDPAQVKMMIEEKNAVVLSFTDNDSPFRHIDVFLRPEHAFENLVAHSETIKVAGRSIRVLNKAKLIELKQRIRPLRGKDRLDVLELKRLVKEESRP